MKNNEKQRTLLQNRAYWKWLEMLAESINDAGYSLQEILEKRPSLSVTKDRLHNDLSKQFIDRLFLKDSSTKLNTKQMLQLEEEMTRFLAEEFGIVEDFPSLDSLLMQERLK